MGILTWIIFGALAGWIASMIMGTNEQQGAVGNIVVGILGAVLGGFVMSLFGSAGVSAFSIRSLLVAILGAVILLFFVRKISHHSSV
jgi:uncharacterized membrane protein YeaQ/YmgE (transglycosylase-associated protein family)